MLRSKRTPKSDLIQSLKKRLRPSLICLSWSWGGLEQTVAKDAEELWGAGIFLKVVCLKDSPLWKQLASRIGPEIIHDLHYVPGDIFDFRMRSELRALEENFGCNLVHTHQPSLLGSIIPWYWTNPNQVIIASRHILSNHFKKSLFHRILYWRLDALIAMSDALRANILETHPVRERQLRVIHLGLDFAQFDPEKVDATLIRKEWGCTPTTVVVGMVGRLDPAKGQDVFIKAAAGLSRNLKEDQKVKFVIVGEETKGQDKRYLADLHQLVKQFRLEDRVVFTGFKENIPEVMRAFDIFVMPSQQEAFGLVAIEALAMECPIVISRGGSSQEIVGSEEFGLLVRPSDPFDLQMQLKNLIEDEPRRSRLGQNGRLFVKKSFDKKIRFQKTLELYDRCLRRRNL